MVRGIGTAHGPTSDRRPLGRASVATTPLLRDGRPPQVRLEPTEVAALDAVTEGKRTCTDCFTDECQACAAALHAAGCPLGVNGSAACRDREGLASACCGGSGPTQAASPRGLSAGLPRPTPVFGPAGWGTTWWFVGDNLTTHPAWGRSNRNGTHCVACAALPQNQDAVREACGRTDKGESLETMVPKACGI